MSEKQVLLFVANLQQRCNDLQKEIRKIIESLSHIKKKQEYEPKDDDFNFGDALEIIKNGRKVSRRCWHNVEIYIFLNRPSENSQENFIVVKTFRGNVVPWCPNHNDILSDDWYLIN